MCGCVCVCKAVDLFYVQIRLFNACADFDAIFCTSSFGFRIDNKVS